jgi:hypothetical protein
MQHIFKKIFIFSLFLNTSFVFCMSEIAQTTLFPVTPYINLRSQSVDIADELAGWTYHVNLYDMDKIYGSLAIKPKYTCSFNANHLTQCLFGVSNCNIERNTSINISGSRVIDRGPLDLLADYFYLPPDFESTISFEPRIDNILADINFYLGFDEWVSGLFFRLHAPLTYTRWTLGFSEDVLNTGTQPYVEGYFTCDTMPRTDLLGNFTQYACGSAPTFSDPFSTTNPYIFNGLQDAKIKRGVAAKFGIADIRAILGWNFLNDEDYHLGIGALVAIPTGTRPSTRFLFAPVIGNGKHWELGAHITGHYMLWRSDDEENSMGFYADANITHLFKTRQRRTFDLKNKPLSRYMLATTFTPNSQGLNGAGVVADAHFANEYTPVANLTTQDVNVSIGVQADIAAQFTYTNCGFAWDLGYNFWGTSCERIRNNCKQCSHFICSSNCHSSTPSQFEENTYALKGDSHMYGFYQNPSTNCINLSATQTEDNHANITHGNNYLPGVSFSVAIQNPGIDNAQLAFFDAIPLTAQQGGGGQTNTSIQPAFITSNDINYQGTNGISHKVYTNFSYQWIGCEDWVPYFGIGGFGEFGSNGNCDSRICIINLSETSESEKPTCAQAAYPTNSCPSCANCSISQWAIWFKFGASFN